MLGCAAIATAAPPPKGAGAHLDLRMPEPRSASVAPRFAMHLGAGTYAENLEVRGDGAIKPAFADVAYERTGGVVALANRFHREGLPVARLWENHSALVSLGLNAKGKPGLWLVQKTH